MTADLSAWVSEAWWASFATFAIAGSITLCATWLIDRVLGRAASSTRELVVRSGLCAAAFAPFVASGVSIPAVTSWDVPSYFAPSLAAPSARTGTTSSAAPTEPIAVGVTTDESPALPTVILLVWFAGAVAAIARVALSLVRVHREARAYPNLDTPDWNEDLVATLTSLGLSKPVVLRIRSDETPAYVLGLVRPTIVLPRSASSWPRAQRTAVLAHELAHVERHDPLWVPLLRCAVALRWFDPLAWWLERRANALREHACDDRAIVTGIRPSSLASALWSAFATSNARSIEAPIAGIARSAPLAVRIEHCLDRDRPRGRPRKLGRMGLQLAMFCAAVALAARAPASVGPSDGASAVRAQARWTDGSVTVGAFLSGTIESRASDAARTRLSPGGRLVLFAIESGADLPRTWIATADSAGSTTWRSFVGDREVESTIPSDASWSMIHDETMRRLRSVGAVGPPLAVPSSSTSAPTSGSTLVGVPACSIDPTAGVVQRTIVDRELRIGVFARRDAWAAFAAEAPDGSLWVAIRGQNGDVLTLEGRGAGDPAALAARCSRAASDALAAVP